MSAPIFVLVVGLRSAPRRLRLRSAPLRPTAKTNLQTICLEQYVRSAQDTENDPIYTKLCEKEKEIDDRYEKLNYHSNEYKKYNKAYKAFQKATKTFAQAEKPFEEAEKTFEQAENTFEKAEEIYNKFKSNLDEIHSNELDVVKNSAAQEKQIMMELVDPNHETFDQCLDCKKIIQTNKSCSCWLIKNCDFDNYCRNCFTKLIALKNTTSNRLINRFSTCLKRVVLKRRGNNQPFIFLVRKEAGI